MGYNTLLLAQGALQGCGQRTKCPHLKASLSKTFIWLILGTVGRILPWEIGFGRVLIAVKRHHNPGNFYKRKIIAVEAYSFRAPVSYRHAGENGGMQTNMVLATS